MSTRASEKPKHDDPPPPHPEDAHGPCGILVRATRLDPRTLAFGDALQQASGHPVADVLDERAGPAPDPGRPVIGLSDSACAALGLYCPPTYPWQCGDYGYYLARRRFPRNRFFWMIEYDVRFTGVGLGEFFRFFARQTAIDFVAADIRPAGIEWHWNATCLARDAKAYRCLFPVTRLSAAAIDALLQKRLRHGRSGSRRALWPNDEGMVATTLMNGQFACRDLNGFGRQFYDEQSFRFDGATNGDELVSSSSELRIHHPVLFDERYRAKLDRLAVPEERLTGWRRTARRITQAINRRSTW